MSKNTVESLQWTLEKDAVEVLLKEPDDFLKIKETLTRIGIPTQENKKLIQSCHILHKQGHYFIMHFKELFILDGKNSSFDSSDRERRNTIAQLLEDWGLLTILDKSRIKDKAALNKIKIVSFKDKDKWQLENKYSIGVKKY